MRERASKTTQLSRGYTFAFISAFFLSTTSIFIRHLTQTYEIPALVLAFWRNVFVTAALLPAFLIIRPKLLRITRKNCYYLVWYGLVMALFNALWTLSVAWNGAAVATVLVYCSVGFTTLLGWWLLKENLGWAKIVAVILSLGGCVIVSGVLVQGAWSSNLIGISAGILGGLMYAIYSLMGRSASQRGLHPMTTLFYIFGFAAVFLLIINLIPGKFPPGKAMQVSELMSLGNAWAGWGILFLLAVIPTAAGFGSYNVALTYLPSSVANLILTAEPVFTAITAYILLGERLTGIQILGSVITLAGVVFLRVYENIQISRNGNLPINPESLEESIV